MTRRPRNVRRRLKWAIIVLLIVGNQYVSNWCNARLIVAGSRTEVLRFSRQSRANPSSIFEADMLVGETQDLFSERAKPMAPNLMKKVYKFQVSNDDGCAHFRIVSKQHPALRF